MIKKLGIFLVMTASTGWSTEPFLQNAPSNGSHSSIMSPLPPLFAPAAPSEDKKSITVARIPEEIGSLILNISNNGGLDLKCYRNQVLVCKQWQKWAINSITTLDLTSLMSTTVHRKCTLLAHIVADNPIHFFTNLRSLKISFEGIDEFEFYKRLTCPQKRSFSEEKADFSDDRRLNRIDSNLQQTKTEVSAFMRNPENSIISKFFKVVSGVCSFGWEQCWHSYITGTPLSPATRVKERGEVHGDLEKSIVTSFGSISKLEEISFSTCFDIDVAFIAGIPNLKWLHIKPVKTLRFDYPQVFVNSLDHLSGVSNLEVLLLDGDTNISNFEGWSTFCKLKELSCCISSNANNEMKNSADYNLSLESLVKNIPSLEILQLRKISLPGTKPFQILSKLPNLRKLNLSDYFVQDSDLEDIAKIASLKELVLRDLEPLREVIGGLYTEKGLDSFKLSRSSVHVSIQKSQK